MKNLLAIIIALHLSLFTLHVSAQWGCTCLPEGITFSSQAEIDSFQTNYPGCSGILGNVEISGTDISYLSELSVLHSIGGNLSIIGCNHLVTLTGLDSLTSVLGSIIIYSNYSLNSLTGLDNIDAASVANLCIAYNRQLSNCAVSSICDYLASPNGAVSIYDNGTGCNNPHEVANSCGFSISCLPYGNYYFWNQAEIDNFQVNYPNCTELFGDVVIGGWSIPNITNLSGLNAITSIDGGLKIYSNDSLLNLTGLGNLSEVGGDIYIHRNYMLVSLTGLENLTNVGGNLTIGSYDGNCGLDSLVNIEALYNLTNVGGNLEIYDNDKLTSLSGLDNLTSVGGDLKVCGNEVLTNLAGLENITYIPGDLSIGTFWYGGYPMGNPSLTSMEALNNITRVEGILEIRFNDALTILTGLNNVHSVGGLDIYYNYNLTSLSGLENLAKVKGDLSISEADGITNLMELSNLDSIAGSLSIYFNNSLASLEGLENITSIGGDLIIYGDYNLTSLSGLENLIIIGGRLSLGEVNNLPSCTGLNNITSIGEDLSIRETNKLTSLTGLYNVTSIGGDLWIYDNDSLSSLSGLDNIEFSSINELRIYENPLLSTCEVLSVCNYLSTHNATVQVYDNAPGCNSQLEVEEACGITGTGEFQVPGSGFRVEVFPNPAGGIVDCRLSIFDSRFVTLKVHDLYGREVRTLLDELKSPGEYSVRMDVSDLPAGVYLVRLQAGEQSDVRKLVVQ